MMNLGKMTLREQILVLVAVAVIVGGAYGVFRFHPANKAIADLAKNTEMMDSAMRAGKIPEEPFENVDDLRMDLNALEDELAEARNMIAGVERRLSPEDTTEVRLAISEIARKARVRISINEAYRVMVPAPVAAAGSKATTAPRKRMGDAAKRRLRNARRASAASLGNVRGVVNVSPEQATALIRKMAINGPMERPMQHLTMEGTFAGVMQFIEDLEQMDKLVTVVQLQMMPVPQSPPPGYNQRLSINMVLAL